MSKRRKSLTGKHGRGMHFEQRIPESQHTGPVKPVVSKTRYGRPVSDPEVSDGGSLVFIVAVALVFIIAGIILALLFGT